MRLYSNTIVKSNFFIVYIIVVWMFNYWIIDFFVDYEHSHNCDFTLRMAVNKGGLRYKNLMRCIGTPHF